MAFWSALGSSFASSSAASAGSSFGSSLSGIARGFGGSDIGKFIAPGADIWTSWQDDEDAYNDDRAYANAVRLANYQYGLQLRGLKEMPSAQREGLINAGYNPLLALGDVAGGGSFSMVPFTGQSSRAKFGGDSTAVSYNRTQAAQREQIEAETALLKAEKRGVEADSDGKEVDNRIKVLRGLAELAALEAPFPIKVDNNYNTVFKRHSILDLSRDILDNIIESTRNKAELDRYLNSKERQIYHDALQGVNSASDAVRSGASIKSALRPPARINNKTIKVDKSQRFNTIHNNRR